MRDEVYLVDSVARAVEEAQTIAQRRWGHFGRIRKVKPGDIKNDRRTVEVQVEVGDAKHWVVVDLQKTESGWVVEKPKERKTKMNTNEILKKVEGRMAEILASTPNWWEVEGTLRHLLRAGHELISAGGGEASDRWQMHQDWTATFNRLLEEAGEELVTGLFPHGVAEELSLIDLVWPQGEFVVGRGWARWQVDQPVIVALEEGVGWEDAFGIHEGVVLDGRIYRHSQTGRTAWEADVVGYLSEVTLVRDPAPRWEKGMRLIVIDGISPLEFLPEGGDFWVGIAPAQGCWDVHPMFGDTPEYYADWDWERGEESEDVGVEEVDPCEEYGHLPERDLVAEKLHNDGEKVFYCRRCGRQLDSSDPVWGPSV